jgi:outer membrane lipoprotein carrier protein
MRFLLLLFLGTLTLLASPKELHSFHALFTQTVVDDHNKKIVYHGELWASMPQNALWVYTKPVQKSISINGSKLTLIEPTLEQVTLRRLGDDIDFLAIIKKAKALDANHYKATIGEQTYLIEFTNEVLSSIRYTDGYDNHVTLSFSNGTMNKPIETSRFKPIIPADFDIIRE